ncbi:MAG: HNH endonuclease [Afipia sp.]
MACKNTAITKDKTCICAVCGKKFERPHGKTRAYCSRSCANKARADGMKMPTITLDARVVGDTVKSTSGYLMVRMNGKKVMQHRLVMEQVIGRPLTPDERVHHRNGKRDDNRPENLELWAGVGSSKKDPHGVRLLDKVLDMIESLTEQEQVKVRQRLEELTS